MKDWQYAVIGLITLLGFVFSHIVGFLFTLSLVGQYWQGTLAWNWDNIETGLWTVFFAWFAYFLDVKN